MGYFVHDEAHRMGRMAKHIMAGRQMIEHPIYQCARDGNRKCISMGVRAHDPVSVKIG